MKLSLTDNTNPRVYNRSVVYCAKLSTELHAVTHITFDQRSQERAQARYCGLLVLFNYFSLSLNNKDWKLCRSYSLMTENSVTSCNINRVFSIKLSYFNTHMRI